MNELGKILGALQEQERHLELEFRAINERSEKQMSRPDRITQEIADALKLQLITNAHIRVQDAIAHLIAIIKIEENAKRTI